MIVLQPGAAFLLVLPYLVDTDVSRGLGLFPPCVRRVGCSPPMGRRVAGLNVPALIRQTVVTIAFIACSFFNTQKRESLRGSKRGLGCLPEIAPVPDAPVPSV